jgi:DnaJ homolog subfamily C member 28
MRPSEHHEPPTSTSPGQPGKTTKDPRQSWSSYVEEQIRAAQERGAFDNLPGAGKPLQLDENPFAGERALAFSLLKSHQLAPREVELAREVDEERRHAEEIVAALRQRRDYLAGRQLAPFPSERRAYNVLRTRTQERYAEALRAVNAKTLSLNITAPSALHRRIIDVEERLRAFRAEFLPLAE